MPGDARHQPRDLALRLRRAPSAELRRLIIDHARELSIREVRQILLNPFVNAEVIEELASVRPLLTVYEVRAALARHPRTPQTLAMRFVAGLFWRDLMEIGVDLRLAPALRRVAEKYLIQRLKKLTIGEKISVARRASSGILAAMRDDPELRVIRSLLENPRLTEPLLLPLVASPKALPRVLDLISKHPRWGRRYDVRAALSRNPRSPLRAVFEILPTLRSHDLRSVLEHPELASIVHHRARQLLDAPSRAPAPDTRQKEVYEIDIEDVSPANGS